MKDKLLDLGLLMALVVVALLVGITLYGPGISLKSFGFNKPSIIRTNTNNFNSTNTSNNQNIETSNSNSSSTDVQVINPNSPNTNTNTATTTDVETVAPATQNETTNTSDTNDSAANTEEVEIQTVSAPLPEGSIELQSIGFSYVTGGAGACGITLKAWKHVAVSRDILAKYPCGSEITINIDKTIAGRSSFTAIVGDTMNKKHTKTVNIYVGRDEPALEYGRQEGSLVP